MTFQSNRATHTSGRSPHSLFSVLNVLTLKHAPCCGVWVGVENLCLTKVYAMTWHECMFCLCGSGHGAIPQSTPMLLQLVFQGLPVCPMYTFGESCAGNRVDHSLSFVHWDSVLGVNQQLAKGHQRTKHHLDWGKLPKV